MPRLTISLPDELRRDQRNGERESQAERSSRRLGSGLEGADNRSQKLLRWFACWAGDD